ncbi:MAG: hypothetical protein OXC18_23295 [Desulfurellaceae bacterium]|nr:hypothetical protein [Desulfurellaceae bacterium]
MSTTGGVGYVDAHEAFFIDDDLSDYTTQWLDQSDHRSFLLTLTLRIATLLILAHFSKGTAATFTAGIGEIGIESVAVGLSGYLSPVWVAVEKLVFITTVPRRHYASRKIKQLLQNRPLWL